LQLENLKVELRPRNAWEASDLGIALVRSHARAVANAWFAIALPVALLVVSLAAYFDQMFWGAVAIWWLKPLFDRAPLHVLSRITFGETPTLKQTLRAQWQLGISTLLPWLLWRRLSPYRGLLLPLDVLEGVRGAQRQQRARVIANGGSVAVLVTFLALLIELSLGLSLIGLSLMFVPVEFFSDTLLDYWRVLVEAPPMWAQVVLVALAFAAMSLVEPIYIGTGFALYLNRRIDLEAWDIELEFRKLGARLRPLAVLLLCVAVALPTARAGPEKPKPSLQELVGKGYQAPPKDFEQAVEALKSDALLHPKERVYKWHPRDPAQVPEIDASEPSDWNFAWLSSGLGQLLRGVVILLASALLCVLGVWLWRNRLRIFTFERRIREPALKPAPALVEAPLPKDIPRSVRALLASGNRRAALALLYRAARERLEQDSRVELPPGSTEAIVLQHARSFADAQALPAIAQIVRLWQAIAWAHRTPSAADIESALNKWHERAPKP